MQTPILINPLSIKTTGIPAFSATNDNSTQEIAQPIDPHKRITPNGTRLARATANMDQASIKFCAGVRTKFVKGSAMAKNENPTIFIMPNIGMNATKKAQIANTMIYALATECIRSATYPHKGGAMIPMAE